MEEFQQPFFNQSLLTLASAEGTAAQQRRPAGQGEVHVWSISLSQSKERMENLFATLSAQEKEKAARFRVDKARNQWIVGRGILRTILSRYIDMSPLEIEFEYGPQGKPSLVNQPSFHFNFSHSGERALCAVSNIGPVGVDIEKIRSIPGADAIAKRYFSPQEQAELDNAPATEKQRVFFQIWTRKEAILKWSGQGIAQMETTPAPASVAIHELTPAPHYAGCLATRKGPPVIRLWVY